MNARTLLQTLAEEGRIDASEIDGIMAEVKQGTALEDVLMRRGVDPDEVLNLKASFSNTAPYTLGEQAIPYEILKYIPEESAIHYKIVPLGVRDGVLEVGAVDPDDIQAIDALNFITERNGLPFKLFVISEQDFQRVLEMYQGLSGEVSRALGELETELDGVTSPETEKQAPEIEDILPETATGTGNGGIEADAPVTKIVATILRYAVTGGASDVHIEHTAEQVRVRFRIDGVLQTSLALPKKVHRAVVARIKILSSMRLDERRKPQGGRFSTTFEGRRIDFRVSTFPAHHGEKVVMRILDTERGVNELDKTGLSTANLARVRAAAKQLYGMILISGPTGSGKTTTLYSLINELDRERKNIVSLEDPIEYDMPGVSQAEIRPEIGFTFASGLRTTLRQDPDIIMVGEIRDEETARLAVQAALTGHLVLATVHTNTAIGAIPRLIDMGIEPYLIAPTLSVVIGQRLVKRLCEGTGEKIPISQSVRVMLEDQFGDLPEQYRADLPAFEYIYKKQSTDDCPTGTQGRIGAFEVFEVDDELENAILESASESKMWKIARKNGMMTMKEDAIIKALEGMIPFEEVNMLGGEAMLDGAAEEATPSPRHADSEAPEVDTE